MIRTAALLLTALLVGAFTGFLGAVALSFVLFIVLFIVGDPDARSHGLVWFLNSFTLGIISVVFILCGALAGGFLMVRHLNRPAPRGFCPCGYDLTGNVSGVCPECGTKIQRP